jgi:GT2 family glycosyltransferase
MLGAYLGPEYKIAYPAPDNPKGFWERKDVVRLNDLILQAGGCQWDTVLEFDWKRISIEQKHSFQCKIERIITAIDANRPWLIKDPRMCITFPLWKDALEIPICVHIYRNPLQVANSLYKRNNIPIPIGMALWEYYTIAALNNSYGLPNILVAQESLIKNPVATIQMLKNKLEEHEIDGLRMPRAKEIFAFIDQKLLHHNDNEQELTQLLNEQQLKLWQSLQAGNPFEFTPPLTLSAGTVSIYQNFIQLKFKQQQIQPAIITQPNSYGLNIEQIKQYYKNSKHQELTNFLNSDENFIIGNNEPPLVSILLVLYNRAELTFACLKSIRDITDINIEVVIVDNASSDSTGELLNRLNGSFKIIRNTNNVHFIKACHQAINFCVGEYVLFLNNDAMLLPNALHHALQVFQEESAVGAVGGKIILPDGTLQEAGSIVWRDGSCYGYGRGGNSSAPEFKFRRSVDYCSGAFLLVQRKTYIELGGFDLNYAPAYYEDTDFCLRLRQRGLDVIYEPTVQILHYESASAENYEQVTTLQRKNRAIFVAKHTQYLATRYPADVRNVLPARSADKRLRMLYIDDWIPHLRYGLGFPRSNFILATLAEHYAVTFFPFFLTGEAWETIYTDIPKRVEVINDGGRANFVRFLQERKDYYAVIVVSRPHNMQFFVAAQQQVYGTQRSPVVIYDAEAIFALRHAMQLQVLKGVTPDWEATVNQELAVARSADRVIVVSEHERNLFLTQKIAAVDVVGHTVTARPIATTFAERCNILFIGNLDYDYSPNVDSIVWFVQQVLPELIKELPDLKLIIVGSNRSQQLRTIHHPAIQFVGMVDDLTPYYANCRIFIAPTRFAAGIPCKVYDAAAYGISVVCSQLIQQQLGWNEGEVLAADVTQPANFVQQCLRLYTDAICWKEVRNRALQRVQQDCAEDKFTATLLGVVTQALQERNPNSVSLPREACELSNSNSATTSTITYAWELGASFGHIGAFLPVANQLRTQGINITWAVTQTQVASKLLHSQGWRWLQAPLRQELRRDTPPLSFADIMLRFGFADVDGLRGLVVAWQELFRLSNTKLVLADHAPAAILAARTLGLPVMLYSYGFCVPPPITPTPSLRPWQPVATGLLLNLEQMAVKSINVILHEFAQPPIQSIAELYQVNETALLTCPDLDHFHNERHNANYWGCVFSSVTDATVMWPQSSSPRIFAYLRRESPYAEVVLTVLQQLGITAIVVFPDAPNELRLRYVYSKTLLLVSALINVKEIIRDADAAIVYGGHGLTAAFLLAGKPLLILPTQLEQFILAKRVVALGAGLMLHPKEAQGDVEVSIRQLLDNAKFTTAAQAVAQRNAIYSQANVVQNVVQRIQQLYCEQVDSFTV